MVKLGKVAFSFPYQLCYNNFSSYSYENLTDKTMGVYILFGEEEEVLYVGYSSQLKKRIISQVNNSHFKDEIVSIHYIINDNQIEAINLEKILYFLLKPKYCKKKINPENYYTMERIYE